MGEEVHNQVKDMFPSTTEKVDDENSPVALAEGDSQGIPNEPPEDAHESQPTEHKEEEQLTYQLAASNPFADGDDAGAGGAYDDLFQPTVVAKEPFGISERLNNHAAWNSSVSHNGTNGNDVNFFDSFPSSPKNTVAHVENKVEASKFPYSEDDSAWAASDKNVDPVPAAGPSYVSSSFPQDTTVNQYQSQSEENHASMSNHQSNMPAVPFSAMNNLDGSVDFFDNYDSTEKTTPDYAPYSNPPVTNASDEAQQYQTDTQATEAYSNYTSVDQNGQYQLQGEQSSYDPSQSYNYDFNSEKVAPAVPDTSNQVYDYSSQYSPVDYSSYTQPSEDASGIQSNMSGNVSLFQPSYSAQEPHVPTQSPEPDSFSSVPLQYEETSTQNLSQADPPQGGSHNVDYNYNDYYQYDSYTNQNNFDSSSATSSYDTKSVFVPPQTNTYTVSQDYAAPYNPANAYNYNSSSDASATPGNAQASYSNTNYGSHDTAPYGRPACNILCFGFGGKIAKYSKDLQQIQIGETKTYFESSNGMKSNALNEFTFLASFPGPIMTHSASKAKELISAYLQKHILESGDVSSDSSEYKLVELLKVLVENVEKLADWSANKKLSEDIALVLSKKDRDGGASWETGSPLQASFNQVEPSEAALEMQNLLCEGKREEALKVAIGGQIWGPAFVLANHMGESHLNDTVSAMCSACLVKDSPLQSFLLSREGRSGHEIHSVSRESSSGSLNFGFLNSANKNKDVQSSYNSFANQDTANSSLMQTWQKNLCILANNRSRWESKAIEALGDRILSASNDIFAAHLCYILGGTNFEPLLQKGGAAQGGRNPKLMLIGSDAGRLQAHSNKSFQYSEIFEWLKLRNNKHHISMAFQPYKLVYAHRLLDIGKPVEAAKYCQHVLKTLQPQERLTSELQLCQYATQSLLQRLHTYLQLLNIEIPADNNKVVSKILGSIGGWLDKGINHIMGSDEVNEEFQNNAYFNGNKPQGIQPNTQMQQTSQMQQPTQMLQPNQTQQPNQMQNSNQNRNQQPAIKESKSKENPSAQKKEGSNLLRSLSRNTIGAVGSFIKASVTDSSKQAKLGETENSFFYDKKLGVWREHGKEPPKAGGALPPPPTKAAPSVTAPTMVPPAKAASNSTLSKPSSGARSRYVVVGSESNTNKASFMPAAAKDASKTSFMPMAVANTSKPSFMPVAPTNLAADDADAGNANLMPLAGNTSFDNANLMPLAANTGFEDAKVMPLASDTDPGQPSSVPSASDTDAIHPSFMPYAADTDSSDTQHMADIDF